MTKNRYIVPFFPLVDAIAETFGKYCEVVLHDFTKPHKSIVKIANSHVTDREVGGPATDLLLSYVSKDDKTDSIIGYYTKSKKGSTLKSTTVFIRDEDGKIVGSLCINIDITSYCFLKKLAEQFLPSKNEEENKYIEKFPPNVDQLIDEIFEGSIQKIGNPVVHMKKKEKLKVIKNLKENGFFHIKGAAKRASLGLNVSLATIYKYLEEI